LEPVLAWYFAGLFTHAISAFSHLAGIFARECDFYWNRRSSFSVYPFELSARGPVVTTNVSQAAKDVRSSQNIILDTFQRIEMFFGRLEVYIEVEPTPEMMDMMVQIAVEFLSILGIATEEIKQGRTSE
jgi:hypothetical protein